MGICLVVYMDNIPIMATAVEILREFIDMMLFLLENLGFIINRKKSLLTLTQEIEFLGMAVNSQTMDLKLPGEKFKKIRLEDRRNIIMLDHPNPSTRSLSQLLGKLNATGPTLQMAPLFCRSLQSCLKQALETNSQDYNSIIQLSFQALEDLQWWEVHLSKWNRRSLIVQQSSMTIIPDASLQWWGALCNGIWTRGSQFPFEQTLHINCLELLAATLAIQTFTKGKSVITVLLKMNNTTAVAYVYQ